MIRSLGFTILLWGVVLGLPLAICAQESLPQRRITVTGTAEINIVPDTVNLSLGIENQGPELNAIREQNARQTTEVLTVIKDFGIPEHQIQTAHLRINPRYDPQQRTLKEYIIQRTLTVSYQDLRRFEDFLIAILAAGVVKVNGLQFDHSQMEAQEAEARMMALQNARDKAEALAGEFDQVLGLPLEIIDGSGPSPGGRMVALSAQSASRNTLAPGQITVGARVTVTFQLQEME